MIMIYKLFIGQDSEKEACKVLSKNIKNGVKFHLAFMYSKAERRKDEKTEKEFLECCKGGQYD